MLEAIEDLQPGFALVTPAHAVIRRFDHSLVGIRMGCSEPIIMDFLDESIADEFLTKWGMKLYPDVPAVTRQIPMDLEEVEYILRAMLNVLG
jgi:hypothetical protein